jgi:hypothetical protein
MSHYPVPPPLSTDSLYADRYCEENIYHLADLFVKQLSITRVWDVSVVFISNKSKAVRLTAIHVATATYAVSQVALWNQKLAESADCAVLWDYHVILVLRLRSEHRTARQDVHAWIYDYDTLLPKPCPLKGASPI